MDNQTHICILKQVIVINCQDGLLKSSFPSEENIIYTEKVYFLNTAYLIKHKKKHSGHMKKISYILKSFIKVPVRKTKIF